MGDREEMKSKVAEKLGMTVDELQDELDSGKTIREIAEERGVEAPARPQRGGGRQM
jgi:hypothetical protein